MTPDQFLVWFDDVVAPTESMIQMVDDSHLGWKLTEKSFTLGQLIAHLPISLQFNIRVLVEEEGLPTVREILVSNRRHISINADAAVRAFRRRRDVFRQTVERITPSDFQHRVIHTPQKGDLEVWRFCAFVLEHHIHHLMELHLSLKALGYAVNTRTLYVGR